MLVEVLAPLGRVSVRRMFSGAGVFCEGVMFGLVVDDVLYLKGNDAMASGYESEGCERFTYTGKGRVISLPYWRMPDRLLDEPDEMAAWARRSLQVALGNAAKRAPAKRKAAGRPIRKR
jgi:DNA transformation protein